MMRTLFAAAAAALLFAAGSAKAQQLTAEHFTQQQTVWGASLSPDGNYAALIQEVPQGDALVIVDWRTRQSTPIQLARHDRSLYIDWVAWKNDNRLLFVLRQRYNYVNADVTGTRRSQGDAEQYDVTRVFAVNRDGSGLTQMFEGQMRRLAADIAPISLIDPLYNDPSHVLLGTYGQRGYTVYRANVGNGRVEAIDDADWDTTRMFVDGQGNPVMRVDLLNGNSGYRIYRRAPRGRWEVAHEVRRSTVAQNRDFEPLGAGPGAGQVYVAARAENEEFQAIYLYDTATGALGQPVYRNERADAAVAWLNPNDHSIMVGCGEAQRFECRAVDPGMQRHFDALTAYFEGGASFGLVSVSRDQNIWMIYAEGPTIPGTYYIYDLAAARVTAVAAVHPQLPRAALAPTQVVDYAARDGARLWGYLTTRPGATGPRPLVVMPHGGPESRDSYEYDFFVQYLATRGYMVFQPNFRGSEGAGRSFAVAGYRQWGRLMQHDITDGVRHLVDTGVADAQRICIVGASYGGYATLAGVTLTPDLYKCGVSIAGVSDLLELLDTERRAEGRGSTTYAYWTRVIGDPNADQAELAAVSPARLADSIRAPMLLIHGTQDDIVLAGQSELMRDAMQRAGKDVRYLPLPGEGHSWHEWSPENRRRLLTETEAFLNQHIGAP